MKAMETANQSNEPVAILTGAAGGVGKATAQALEAAGYQVMMVGRTESTLRRAAESLSQAGVVVADVSKAEDRRRIVDETLTRYGRIDLLVNNAGQEETLPLESTAPGTFEHLAMVNLVGPAELAALVIPQMLHQGRGHVVNLSTMGVFWPLPFVAAYTGSKAGLGNLSRTIRAELRERGVSASTIYPGAIAGDGMFEAMLSETGRKAPKLFPRVRPEQVAAAIVAAVRQDRAEVYATPLGWLLARLPGLAVFAAKQTGAMEIFTATAKQRSQTPAQEAQPSKTQEIAEAMSKLSVRV